MICTGLSVFARSRHRGIYDTHGDTTAPHTDRPSDAAEGATALSLARLFVVRGFLYTAPLPLLPACLSTRPFFLCPEFGFYYWVRGARFGVTTDIGLLEEF